MQELKILNDPAELELTHREHTAPAWASRLFISKTDRRPRSATLQPHSSTCIDDGKTEAPRATANGILPSPCDATIGVEFHHDW